MYYAAFLILFFYANKGFLKLILLQQAALHFALLYMSQRALIHTLLRSASDVVT